jgi:hypothetical protein
MRQTGSDQNIRFASAYSTKQWNCIDIDHRCGRRASGLCDSGACSTRPPNAHQQLVARKAAQRHVSGRVCLKSRLGVISRRGISTSQG